MHIYLLRFQESFREIMDKKEGESIVRIFTAAAHICGHGSVFCGDYNLFLNARHPRRTFCQ